MNKQSVFNLCDNAFKILTEHSSQGISVSDLNGNYLYVNPAFCQLLQYSADELLSMSVFDTKITNQEHILPQNTNDKENEGIRVTLKQKSGATIVSEITGKKMQLSGHTYIVDLVQDISDKLAIEEALIKNEQRDDVVMEVVNDGIWDSNLLKNTIHYDERFYTMAGYQKDEFPQTYVEWEKRVHPEDLSQTITCYKAYLAGKSKEYDVEYRFLCQDQSYMWIQAKGKVVERDQDNTPIRFIGTHTDISVQKKYQEKILHQAHFDSLTYLPNRFLSLELLSHACIDAKRKQELVVLLFLDLDDFKKINDSLGHNIGDLLLIQAANRLRNVVRSVDTIGRLGGDEFIIILTGLKSIEDAHSIIENLLNQFRELFLIKNREIMLTASVGAAVYPNDAENSAELLRNADSAMYDAKGRGRNTYSYFTSYMNQCAQRRMDIEEQLNGALSRDEFTVFFQPKVDILSQRVMGAEALLRWYNPILGHVPPDEFITIAEQTGHIIDIGKFVLQQSLKQTARWYKQLAGDFQIAVNLSPRQFMDPTLLPYIKECLTELNIPSSKLELEITEGVLLSGHNHADKILTGLNNQGITMAMDDFGTGYSSLNYLRSYPFDVLKIDRSFINEITETDKTKSLIDAIISMSHALGIKVVAEGIETKEQLAQLKHFNCDYGQGYLFSKPISADDMSTLINKSTMQALPIST